MDALRFGKALRAVAHGRQTDKGAGARSRIANSEFSDIFNFMGFSLSSCYFFG